MTSLVLWHPGGSISHGELQAGACRAVLMVMGQGTRPVEMWGRLPWDAGRGRGGTEVPAGDHSPRAGCCHPPCTHPERAPGAAGAALGQGALSRQEGKGGQRGGCPHVGIATGSIEGTSRGAEVHGSDKGR